VMGQPPPPELGCTFTAGRGSVPGVVAGEGGQSLAVPLSGVARIPVGMGSTGVQHLSIDLAFTSPPYTTGRYSDWRGLDWGYLRLLDATGSGSAVWVVFDGAAWNSPPTSYMNNEDLIVKGTFYGAQPHTTPFASPASYHFEFTFDFGNNTTTFAMFAAGGTTPLATWVWTGAVQVGAVEVMSRAWWPDPPAEGTTTYVDNVFVGSTSTPTTVSLDSTGTPAAVGTPVTFTATVSGSAPTGEVTFYDGATVLGTATLNAASQARLTISSLTRGTHTLTAQYGGDPNNTGSTSPPFTQEILLEYVLVTIASPASGGALTEGGACFEGSTQTITATAHPGWLFDHWTGDAAGTANPIPVLMDGNKSITANFSHDLRDEDGDGLSTYDEAVTHGTNPTVADTDGDGFDDGFEVGNGYSPTSATSTPDSASTILTAVEFRFNAARGVSYRIETSTNLVQWTTVEPAIPGQGGVVTRFYSIENQVKRYYRAVRN